MDGFLELWKDSIDSWMTQNWSRFVMQEGSGYIFEFDPNLGWKLNEDVEEGL